MPVAIIGMHRSGTSLLARALNLCGVYLGDEADLVSAHASNEKGHWEHRAFVDIDDRILAHFGGSWSNPPELPADWLERHAIQALADEARAVIRSTFADKEPWGWKDPRATAIIPFWRQVVPDLRFVVCVRNPLDVAGSLTARDQMPSRLAFALWQYYTELALRHTSPNERVVVHYDDCLADYPTALDPVLNLLRLPALTPDSPQDRAVADFVESGLSHHNHSPDDVMRHTGIPIVAKLLYDGLRHRLPATLALFDGASDDVTTPGRSTLDYEMASHLRARAAEADRHAVRVEAEYQRIAEHARRADEHARRADAAYRRGERTSGANLDGPMASTSIYLSASPLDRAFAHPFAAHLCDTLELPDRNRVYLDECAYQDANASTMQAVWTERLESEITSRPLFVIILTPHATSDEIVRAETRFALELRATDPTRRIVGILIEPCDLAAFVIPPEDLTIIDFVHQPYDIAMAALVELVRRAPVPGAIAASEPDALPVATRAASAALDAGAQGEPSTRIAQTPPPQRANRVDPVLASHVLAHAHAQRWEAVLEAAPRALALTPFRADLWNALGQAHSALGQPAAAIDAIDHVRALTPLDDMEARMDLLAARYTQELRQKLMTLVQAADRPEGEASAWLAQRLDHLLNLGHYEAALAVAGELTATPMAKVTPWIIRARLAAMGEGRAEEVRECAQSAAALAGGDPGIAAICKNLTLERSPLELLPQRMTDLGFELRVVDNTEIVLPPVCAVPAGHFVMGSDSSQDPEAYPDEQPCHQLILPHFEIMRFPVTVAEYARFIQAGHRPPHDWSWQLCQPDQPVTHVSWRDARAYAVWLARVSGEHWRLPVEAEWEKAARWDAASQQARRFPWGEAFEPGHCNCAVTELRLVTPVGCYPLGGSPCGAQDLAGNVWEWTDSVFADYPLVRESVGLATEPARDRVLRGGSARDLPRFARAACRTHRVPIALGPVVSFRLVRATSGA